jgi:hypothetical protein
MTQKAKVICGSLFIVCRSGKRCGDGDERYLKNRFADHEKSVQTAMAGAFTRLNLRLMPSLHDACTGEAYRALAGWCITQSGQSGREITASAPTYIDKLDSLAPFFALFNQINRRSIKPIETNNHSNQTEQRP